MINHLNSGLAVTGPLVFAAGALIAMLAKSGSAAPGHLAATGSSLGPALLVVLAVLLVGGIVLLLLGRRGKVVDGADPGSSGTSSSESGDRPGE